MTVLYRAHEVAYGCVGESVFRVFPLVLPLFCVDKDVLVMDVHVYCVGCRQEFVEFIVDRLSQFGCVCVPCCALQEC